MVMGEKTGVGVGNCPVIPPREMGIGVVMFLTAGYFCVNVLARPLSVMAGEPP